uniref:Uncharacterized protein n=1 Tax=Meloidogyne enterolobii TaxID=390850 RepID=A0A6V7U5Z0_MELEN|nr:unnamed protein product [Meloidogyne enterolobii]
MALIYASAVNRRMNALQKKNSADITPHSHNQHSELFQHCKQRSNEDSAIPNVFNVLNNDNNGGGVGINMVINEKKQYRKMSNAKNNAHSNPIINGTNGSDVFGGNDGSSTIKTSTNTNSGGSTNSNCNNNKAAALLQFQQQLLLQQQQQNNQQKKGTQARDQLAALFNRLVVDDSTPRSRPHRKISTPVMAQSMTASMYGNMNGEKSGGRRNSKKSSKPNSPISPNNDSKGHFFAKFGKAIRRRSVSADESMFRKRVGTVSSIDSSQGGEESLSPNTRSRKTSALNRMKERLNKWKISG